LHDRHVSLGGRIVDFHGWLLPVQYDGVLAEHRHCRSAASLFDTSHMGQILIVAPDPNAISRVLTQDAGKLTVGRGKYGFLLNERGGIIDDTVLIRLGDDEFFLVVNAGTQQEDLDWLKDNLSGSAEATSRSAEGWSKIDLQGPQAAAVLAPLTDAGLVGLGYFRATKATVCGQGCILSRTGYTGELGYEMFAPGDSIVRMFDDILADERVRPAGLGARDSLRLEMCYPLHGEDIDAGTNPVEADLGFALKSSVEYIGAKAVAQAAERGPARGLAAFASRTRRRFAHGDKITSGGREVGTVTSGAFSPSLEVSIGMGYVEPALAQAGTELLVETERASIPVTVADKPLYKHGTCRTKEVL
jgi:aminomethyltransferase